ncbi:MAG TPA: UTP--glucose-1-phosphate uridylyltransferase [Ilumatobacteraceae bacterium]|nr:UTP--glucose-1-phosphate uridylyltransferase [Ilumatobacteraceae bacterium]
MRVHTAVIPAAGLGTRFRPVTKVVPKELLPIIDTPALQLVLDECAGAGIDHVVLVTSRTKPGIEQFGRTVDGMRISIAYQDEPKGLGHAVGCARDAVGTEPFAVLLPDELMGDSGLLTQMIDVCERSDGSVVGLTKVPRDKVSAYGVIDPSGPLGDDGVVPVQSMVEKPPVDEAPSDLIIIGRYVLTNDVLDLIDQLGPGAGGEIQLTDALRQQAASGPFHGVVTRTTRFDTGNPFGWLTAVIDYALARPELGERLDAWMRERLARGETT